MIGALMGVPGKLKTLIDRLTSTRATNLDNLDATISSRAAASTALSTATWTATRAGYLDALSSAGANASIKSIQTGYFGGTPAGTSSGEIAKYQDVTLGTAVTVAKAVVFLQGFATDVAGNIVGGLATGYLTSTTNLRLGTQQGNSIYVRYYVVEFY